MVKTTCNERDGKVTLTWKQPNRNGAAITRYKIYQKKGSEKNWMEIATIPENNSSHKYVVRDLDKDEVYVFLVTATNKYGESSKNGNCKGVKVPEGTYNVTLSNIVVCEKALKGGNARFPALIQVDLRSFDQTTFSLEFFFFRTTSKDFIRSDLFFH